MSKRPSARWVGTFDFEDLDVKLAVKLCSSERKDPHQSLLVQVHADCKTRIPSLEKSKREKDTNGEKGTTRSAAVQTTREIRCPSCARALRPEEITLAVDIPNVGFILLSPEEINSLSAKKVKEVKVSLRRNPVEALATIGTGRRLYIMPKDQSVNDYYRIMRALRETQTVGFIRELAIERKFYVLVIRPITTPETVFGTATDLLVADEFFDTEMLVDPLELQMLPKNPPDIADEELERLKAKISLHSSSMDLSECVNPKQLRLENLIREKAAPVRPARFL
jgi:non-homologous end joining protein Ku